MQRLDVAKRRDQRFELSAPICARLRAARGASGQGAPSAFSPARVNDTSRVRASRPGAIATSPRSASGSSLRDSAVRSSSSLPRDRDSVHRAARRERAQQRELRDAQSRRRHRVVVELGQRARRAAQPAAGAGGRGRDEGGGIGAIPLSVHMHVIGSICTFRGNASVRSGSIGAVYAHRFARSTALFQPASSSPRAVAGHRGLEDAIDAPVGGDVGGILPVADREAGQVGGAERRGLEHLRPHDRHAEHVGLESASAGCWPRRRRRRAARSA